MKKNSTITGHVLVNRKSSVRKILDKTNRKQYISDELINELPKGSGIDVEISFFFSRYRMSHDKLVKKYEDHKLKPDPIAQSAYNTANPDFADNHPNATHWKNSKGEWCHIDFDTWKGERRLGIRQYGVGFNAGYWYGGVRE